MFVFSFALERILSKKKQEILTIPSHVFRYVSTVNILIVNLFVRIYYV